MQKAIDFICLEFLEAHLLTLGSAILIIYSLCFVDFFNQTKNSLGKCKSSFFDVNFTLTRRWSVENFNVQFFHVC